MVRAKGIEPSSSAWEADVLPLYHARRVMARFYTPFVKKSSTKHITKKCRCFKPAVIILVFHVFEQMLSALDIFPTSLGRRVSVFY